MDVQDDAWLMRVDRGRTPLQGKEEPEAGLFDAKLPSSPLILVIMKKKRRNCLSFLSRLGEISK